MKYLLVSLPVKLYSLGESFFIESQKNGTKTLIRLCSGEKKCVANFVLSSSENVVIIMLMSKKTFLRQKSLNIFRMKVVRSEIIE